MAKSEDRVTGPRFDCVTRLLMGTYTLVTLPICEEDLAHHQVSL